MLIYATLFDKIVDKHFLEMPIYVYRELNKKNLLTTYVQVWDEIIF